MSRADLWSGIVPASDEEVEARLASFGVPREFIFLLPGENPETGGLLMTWEPVLGLRYVIIENDSLARGCYLDLLRRGARQFASETEATEAAMDEDWPGWRTSDQFTRGFSMLRKNIAPETSRD